ncbi:MAG TPA: cell division protein ZipA C-terminal FtsZ-binding domain-containing protein, partial [Pseudomonadales bacterium]|nr:cell division protein ZipA C-terminal FtsZ-binding domain-containing protein [Pseudomonadales bacterium]
DEPLFSCANAVKPGIFDVKTMDQITTPGVSMFMQMPNGEDSMHAFEELAIAAGNIAARLGAELQDDTRSVMTRQTLEHYRQKVLDFERRRRMRLV